MTPSIPSGTRDFGPVQARKRKYIFQTLESVFNLFGYEPIETPAMENLSTLAGKYGEEGDQLLYKILNSRLNESKKTDEIKASFDDMMNGKTYTPILTERALRYDLTIPFARFVALNHRELAMPFKRYQIQPVWRADRPQKGRYREFYQCDVDIIGSNSIYNEAELISLVQLAYKNLGIKHYTIKINHRKLLQGIASHIQAEDKFIDLTVCIDKLDKIGWEGVSNELIKKGFLQTQIDILQSIFKLQGNYLNQLNEIKSIVSNELTESAIKDLQLLYQVNPSEHLELDFTLARGLNYYTGCIFEVVISDPTCTFKGSISGGGRYDDLTGIFDVKGLSGVGISFGADRIYDVMEELNLFPDQMIQNQSILICAMDELSLETGYRLMKNLIQHQIRCELYPDNGKMKKMLGYADKKGLKQVIIIGENERVQNQYILKNMQSGTQELLNEEKLINQLKSYEND